MPDFDARFFDDEGSIKPELTEALSNIEAVRLCTVDDAIHEVLGETRDATTAFVEANFGEEPAEAKELLTRILFAEARRQVGEHIADIVKGDFPGEVLDLDDTLSRILDRWAAFRDAAPSILESSALVCAVAGAEAGLAIRPIDD